MKHTPSPWEIDYDARPASVCTVYGIPPHGEENQQFCYIRGPIGYWDADEQENMANAMLIAAAPDILQALRECAAMIRVECADGEHHEVYIQAMEAIRKATDDDSI